MNTEVRPEVYFAEELHRYLSAEEERMERAERVEEQAQYMLENEFYPFTLKNFSEALAQMSDDMIRVIAELAEKHDKEPLEPKHAMALADAICREARRYWLDMARYIAEKEVGYD